MELGRLRPPALSRPRRTGLRHISQSRTRALGKPKPSISGLGGLVAWWLAWWLDRVRDVGYDQGLANTDLGYIATMVHTLEAARLLKLSLPFKGFRIAGEKHNPRVPYDPDFVRTRILPGTEFASMNSEACAVVVIVAATGMRPSEIVGLTAPRIKLDAAIPRVEIRPDLRQLKTVHSQRNIPLVGRALK